MPKRLETPDLIEMLNRLSAARMQALCEAGLEPYVEVERSAQDQRRAGRAIYEWRKRRLEDQQEDES